MRTLVISDIHGNLPALQAVLNAEAWDELICLGDLVAYGPDPIECVRLIRSAGATTVQGNHDRALAERVAPRCRPTFERLAEATHAFARSEATDEDVAYLAGLPRWLFVERDGRRHLLVHATPSDPLYRYLAPDAPEWVGEVHRSDVRVVLVGHTHQQFRRDISTVTVVNPGSVGQPKDGDPTAAYAVIEDGRIHLRRVTYRVEDTIAGLQRRALAEADVADLSEILRTGSVPARLKA
jgi:predicted phosphodiesterase